MKEKKAPKKNSSKLNAENAADEDIFLLPAQMDITSIAQISNDITSMYTGNNITFDASKVERITTPGVQLLLATSGTAKARGGKVLVQEPSEAFTNIISELGFSNQLKEWMGNNG